MAERSAVELMLVEREPGREREAECGSCGRLATLNYALFVGSFGEACGAVEVCDECAPRVSRLAENMIALLPPAAGAMLTAD
jgi:hypothetical protein